MTPETIIECIIISLGLEFIKEFKFHPVRKWRFDYIIVSRTEELKLALEIDGGSWISGRHNRGKGFEEDHIKFNQATCHGWKVLRYTTGQIKTNPAMIENDIKYIVGTYER